MSTKPLCFLAAFTLLTSIPAFAAPPKSEKLTPEQLAELTSTEKTPAYRRCKVVIADLADPKAAIKGDGLPEAKQTLQKGPVSLTLKTDGKPVVVEWIRELRFPVAFDVAKPIKVGEALVTPTTPTKFETVNTGWTIKLTAEQQGKLIALAGVAEYAEAELLPGGYGKAAEPIYSAKGDLISPNKLMQPKVQSTASRFFIFAEPGESYEVTLHRGDKAEKHRVTVSLE